MEEIKPSPTEFHFKWRSKFSKKNIFNFESVEVEKVKDHESTLTEAIELANKLTSNVDTDQKGFLKIEDFHPFFRFPQAAETAFSMFDRNKDGKIELEEIIVIIREIYKDRKALYNTLHDREDIAKILNNSLGVIFWIFMFLLSLTVFGVNMQTYLVPISTSVIGLAFIFGESLKLLWNNFIFIFFVRPYDVGDKIVIQDSLTYPTLTVHKISLLVTEAYSGDGRLFLLPNDTIRAKVIVSFKRSKNYVVTLQLQLGFDTKKEHIEKFEKRIRKWLKNDTAPWNFDDMYFAVSDLQNLNKLVIDVSIELKGISYQTGGYTAPKGRLWLWIQHQMKELGIQYHLPVQPVFLKKIE